MAEIDTSSYPKPAAAPQQKTVLDQAKQWGDLQSQQISIGQAQLKQMNDQFQVMNNELANLADGNPSKQEAAIRLTRLAKTFNLKPQIVNHMMAELNEAPNVKSFAERALLRGQTTMEKVNSIYGAPINYDNGQTVTPSTISPMRGLRQIGQPIQIQNPPSTPTVDENNRPRLLGPQPPQLPPGTVATPTNVGGAAPTNLPFPVANAPIAPRVVPTEAIKKPQGDTGVTPDWVSNKQVFNDRFPQPTGPATGQSPLFSQGLGEYTKDMSEASGRASSIKNLTQAYPLITSKGFLSGPGTDAFTNAVAALKTWGLVDIDPNSDPTAIRQEVNKKLANYISNSPIGQRSDAQQSLKEAASPSAKVQILPALKRLVKDAVALERVQIAMPNVFKGQDYQNYIKHKGSFPQSVDERAFSLDMEEDHGKKLVDEMRKRLEKNPRDSTALKFKRSLEIADEQGFYK